MATYTTERVIAVQHWSDRLFSFRTTRHTGLRFENGQFIMLGLELGAKKVVRAYSIASANHEEHLEFYSIKVPDGPLTSRLRHIEPGASVLVSSKPTGTLVLRDVRPGKRLLLLATGTGVAPFIGLAKDPDIYEQFEQVVLVRGARHLADLAYGDAALAQLRADPHLGELARARLLDYPTVTREAFRHHGRITNLVDSGRVFEDLGITPLDPAHDRFMICGNMRMLADSVRLLAARGLEASPQIGVPGDYVFERAFVESFEPSPVAPAPAVAGGDRC
jgi:ferredoxin--NADP+ reductase